jgi:hypothetical protein
MVSLYPFSRHMIVPPFDDASFSIASHRRQWSFHIFWPLLLATGASVAVATCNRTVVHPLPETILTGSWLQQSLPCYLQAFLQVGGRPRRGVLAHTLFEPIRSVLLAPGASVAVATCNRTAVHPLSLRRSSLSAGSRGVSFVIYSPSKLAE